MQDAQEILDCLFKVQAQQNEWEPDDPQVLLHVYALYVYVCVGGCFFMFFFVQYFLLIQTRDWFLCLIIYKHCFLKCHQV